MTERPNILLITVDDMNWDAVGAFGCPTPETTPNIDRLASEGMKFDYAHVTIAVCQPSRSVMMSGRYPHKSGGEGFYNLTEKDVPIAPALLRDAGYRVGILGKVGHSTPYKEFAWDMTYDMDDLGHGRNPDIYKQYATEFVTQAETSDTPFFLMFNSHDPHRPFYGNDKPEWYEDGGAPKAAIPSRTFTPEEVTVPGFLADVPGVRQEIAEYYNSVRRADDIVGGVLETLDAAGCADNTLLLFLSDNGMAFPFSKTNCYLNSTRTPFIVRWPGKAAPGSVNTEHFVSGIDMLPTILEVAGVECPDNVDGKSFFPLLLGAKQVDRDYVYTQFHQTAGKRNYPMRCVQNQRFGYIFNPWSNGTRRFINESQAGRSFNAMDEAAQQDPAVAARVKLFLYRVPEEFYDFKNDPDALKNLIDDPAYADDIAALRTELERWMTAHDDPALEAFRKRESPEAREAFMQETAATLGGEA